MARQLHEIDRFDQLQGRRATQTERPSLRRRLALDASVADAAYTFADLPPDQHALAEAIRRPTRRPSNAAAAGKQMVRLLQALRGDLATARDPISSRVLIDWNLELGGRGVQKAGEPRPKHLEPGGERGLMPPRASLIAQRLAALLDSRNRFDQPWVHPLLQVGVTYFVLCHDRPFALRNRATARVYVLESLLQRGYSGFATSAISPQLAELIDQRSVLFFDAAESSDLSAHLSAFLTALWNALNQADETTQSQLRSFGALQAVAQRQRFNLRELALLDHALRHPDNEYSIRTHQRIHGVAYATARKDLKRLSALELFEESQPGERELVYRPAPYLKTRLSAS